MSKHFLPLAALVFLAGCTGAPSSTPTMTNLSSAPSMNAISITPLSGKHNIVLHTSQGDVALELNADIAPKAVTNFVTLAKEGYYENLTFHRVIPGFMIQGGDPSGNGTGGRSIYGETFADEIDPSSPTYQKGYVRGVVAMANYGPDTNGSQFFIMEHDYPLDPNYTIFGRVTSGQDVVSKIANVPRGANDRPVNPVTFTVEVKG